MRYGLTPQTLLWDQEHGTLDHSARPGPGDGITFREYWGVARRLPLPQVHPHAEGRYVRALKDCAHALREHAVLEYVPSTEYRHHDSWTVDYEEGHQPHLAMLERILAYVNDDDLAWQAARQELNPRREQERLRALRAERIRSLVLEGDASYTPARPGQRYSWIRLDERTGHLSAHTAPGQEAEGVRQWRVSPLSARQANQVMRALGVHALRLARPQVPGTVLEDPQARMDEVLASLCIDPEQAAEHVRGRGLAPTEKRCEAAVRSLLHARVQQL